MLGSILIWVTHFPLLKRSFLHQHVEVAADFRPPLPSIVHMHGNEPRIEKRCGTNVETAPLRVWDDTIETGFAR
jgi:hypothetical protein